MIDRRLRSFFGQEHEVATVGRRSRAGKKNGELLEHAQHEFDTLVTTDRSIPHQQNLARFDLAIVVLEAKSNSYEDLAALMTMQTPPCAPRGPEQRCAGPHEKSGQANRPGC